MRRKRVLVVENFDDTGLGQIRPAIAAAGYAIDGVRAHRGQGLPPDSRGHDALVVLGGGQNALDDAGSPHLPQLLQLIRDFESSDKSVLGVCLGSQLMARAFGGENQIGGATEFGWREVLLTADGAADAVLSGLPEAFPIFQWHDDTFSLPPGAVWLAYNQAARNQAFRVGRAAYGVQFHFEADRAHVRDWNHTFAETIAAAHPDWPQLHAIDAARFGPAADEAGRVIAERWVATI